jgi:hypothetical protein
LGDRRNGGEKSCNSGDGTGQMAQPLMFMMMMMMIYYLDCGIALRCEPAAACWLGLRF